MSLKTENGSNLLCFLFKVEFVMFSPNELQAAELCFN